MALSKLQAELPISVSAERSVRKVVFRFRIPDGLALRSVGIVDGVPQLRFESSPKVPALLEEDVATAFRLASENKRPEFFYLSFPLTHPLHESRWFNYHSPQWLRGTNVGKLLADSDWNMKCLNVGARTNEEKAIFKSWAATSKLSGLAMHRDFPSDGDGSNPTIKMHCDYAKVQKDENNIFFPEEPKMKIVDGTSSQYSRYITESLPSIAYHDEPKFLKMQELIKLILAVEWLYNEKGVEVCQDWVMMHTAKTTDDAKDDILPDLPESKEPPKEMIPPQPSEFEPPSTEVTISTRDSKLYDSLKTDLGINLRYGYIDFGGAEVKVFTEDGTEYFSQKCLKISFEHHNLIGEMKGYLYLPVRKDIPITEIPKEGFLQLLPTSLHQEISTPMPVSVSTSEEDSTDEKGMKLKLTISASRHPPLTLPHFENVTVIRATEDDLDYIFANEDPNAVMKPDISGVCETIFPGVNSWEELISELSTPKPRFWQDPYIGIGQATAEGGVSTRNFEVRSEPLGTKRAREEPGARAETVWKDNFKRRDSTLLVRSAEIRRKGKIQIVSFSELNKISRKVLENWKKGSPPTILGIFAITNDDLQKKWDAYKRSLGLLGHPQVSEEHFHGTMLACDITTTQALCTNGNCGICGITCAGMDPKCIRKHIDFQRFGPGFYLAPHSSKCNDYTQKNARGQRAMLLCDVLPGRKFSLQTNGPNLTGPPAGHDSVNGVVGSELNYPEIVVYNPHAVMPRFIIVYQ